MTDHTRKKSTSVYFPNLDAARFLAAFAVLMLHYSNELRAIFPSINDSGAFKFFYLFTSKGSLGVNFFFVLSGFLITFLILNEREKFGFFHVGKFLIRRTLRIWPLYFIIGLIGFILFPLLFSDYSTLHDPLYYFFFLANFDELWNASNDSINFLTSPWSVAVEEQFYLFWGGALFMLFKIKKISLELLIIVLFIGSYIFQAIHWTDEQTIYLHTLAVCQDILMGAFSGLSLFKRRNWLERLKKMPKIGLIIIYGLGILICLAKNKIFSDELIVFERSIISLFFAFIILDQIRGNHSFFKFGSVKILNYLGKISYGIYMYHLVVMYLLLRFIPFETYSIVIAAGLFFVLSIGTTLVLSAISYRFIESKFLSLKPKHSTK